MKTKIITISLIAIGLSSVACRENDEMLMENEQQQLSLKSQKTQQATFNSGSQWRIYSANENSLKIDMSLLEANKEKECPPPPPPSPDPPRNSTHWRVSSNEDCKEPPRNGTHWRMGAKN